MTTFRLILEIIGGIFTIVSVAIILSAIVGWIIGVYPLFLRLGFGRWSRKIMIAGSDEKFNSLKSDLVATGVFRDKNISQISKQNLAKLKDCNLVLVHYQSFSENEIKTILSNKKAGAGFVFYFPEFCSPNHVIPKEIVDLINNEQFTTVVNMRGRLINDLLVMLLSTSYEKK